MPKKGNPWRSKVDRRRFVQLGGIGGATVVAGCLGDDDVDDADDTDDVDDMDDVDIDDADDTDDHTADDTDDTDDTDDAGDVEEIQRYDVYPLNSRQPPLPPDAQYNNWAGGPVGPNGNWGPSTYLVADRSAADFQVYGELAADWDYQPGLLEFTLHEDFYWWSGDQVTIDDYLMRREMENYVWGGEELDAHDSIVAFEKIDDFTARLSLIDTWREDWALEQVLVGSPIHESRAYNQPWLEEFEDAGDLDAIGDLRDDLEEDNITDDERLVDHFNHIFEFRVDGSIGNVTDTYWHCELVPEKNGNKRHFADQINFTEFRWAAVEEHRVRSTEDFLSQEGVMQWLVHMPVEDLDDPEEIDFAFKDVRFAREADQWGFSFDFDMHPADNVHFRRAWAFMTNNEIGSGPSWEGQQYYHPFLRQDRLELTVSEDVVGAFKDYTWDDWDHDQAEAEMVRGGFERNADGEWLLQSDTDDRDAGEPIHIDVGTHNWGQFMANYGSDWQVELEEFGISNDLLVDDWGTDTHPVQATFSGGLLPEEVLGSLFTDSPLWGSIDHHVPSTVLAPEIGETDADPDDWVEYDTAAMADRLAVTTQAEAHQNLVDQLAWVANHLLPRFTVLGHGWVWLLNDEDWRFADLDERPDGWFTEPEQHVWYNGVLNYRGD